MRVTQYMEASLRILQVKVSEDNASMSDVMDYIGNITKIATRLSHSGGSHFYDMITSIEI